MPTARWGADRNPHQRTEWHDKNRHWVRLIFAALRGGREAESTPYIGKPREISMPEAGADAPIDGTQRAIVLGMRHGAPRKRRDNDY